MFSRGNETSGEPICSGIIALAKPANNAVANKNSIKVPCMVNSWLYCSLLKNCKPGDANSARIPNAIAPAITKKAKEVIMYRLPITLWSVDVIHLTTVRPLVFGRIWPGVETGLSKSAMFTLLLLRQLNDRNQSRQFVP